MKIRVACVAAIFTILPAIAQAQERKPASAETVKALLDNDRVRAFEMSFRPGAKLPAQAHPPRLMYMLTEGALVFSEEGKRPYEMIFKAGEAVWVPAQAHTAENSGDQEVRALIVEVKQAAASGPAKTRVKRKTRTRPLAKTAQPAPAAQQ